MEHCQSIRLDLSLGSPASALRTNFCRHDNGVYPLLIRLTSEGKPFPIPGDARVFMYIETPSGKTLNRVGRVENPEEGGIRCELKCGDLRESGEHRAQVTIRDRRGNQIPQRLSWPIFSYSVAPSVAASKHHCCDTDYEGIFEELDGLRGHIDGSMTQIEYLFGEIMRSIAAIPCNGGGAAQKPYDGAVVGRAVVGRAIVGKVA